MELKEIVVKPVTFTPEALSQMVRNGDLILNNTYGLNREKLSKIVEAVVSGVPAPAVVLKANSDGTYSVIEGNDAIVALAEFVEDCYVLEINADEPLLDWDGLKYSYLSDTLRRKFRMSTIYALVVIKGADVFEKLLKGDDKQ